MILSVLYKQKSSLVAYSCIKLTILEHLIILQDKEQKEMTSVLYRHLNLHI